MDRPVPLIHRQAGRASRAGGRLRSALSGAVPAIVGIAASGVLTDDVAKVDVGHRIEEGRDLLSMSGILADTAYRLLLA